MKDKNISRGLWIFVIVIVATISIFAVPIKEQRGIIRMIYGGDTLDFQFTGDTNELTGNLQYYKINGAMVIDSLRFANSVSWFSSLLAPSNSLDLSGAPNGAVLIELNDTLGWYTGLVAPSGKISSFGVNSNSTTGNLIKTTADTNKILHTGEVGINYISATGTGGMNILNAKNTNYIYANDTARAWVDANGLHGDGLTVNGDKIDSIYSDGDTLKIVTSDGIFKAFTFMFEGGDNEYITDSTLYIEESNIGNFLSAKLSPWDESGLDFYWSDPTGLNDIEFVAKKNEFTVSIHKGTDDFKIAFDTSGLHYVGDIPDVIDSTYFITKKYADANYVNYSAIDSLLTFDTLNVGEITINDTSMVDYIAAHDKVGGDGQLNLSTAYGGAILYERGDSAGYTTSAFSNPFFFNQTANALNIGFQGAVVDNSYISFESGSACARITSSGSSSTNPTVQPNLNSKVGMGGVSDQLALITNQQNRINIDSAGYVKVMRLASSGISQVFASSDGTLSKSTQLTASLTDGTPTDAQIDTATGLTPATAGAGYQVTIKDSDGTGLLYKVESDGSGWYVWGGTMNGTLAL